MANRQNTFILKRSGVPGKIPSPGDIQLGEIAVNFADAKAYLSGTTAGSILPIGWDRVSITGGTISGNLTVTGTTTSNIFSGTTISGGTLYGNGSNLTGIPDFYVTGGTLSSGGTLTLTRNDAVNINISGFSGSTDTYTTGTTFTNNILTIKKNNGSPDVTQLLNNFSGLTINGGLTVTGTTTTNILSGTTISGGTFFGNGSNLTGIIDTFTTGFTYSNNNLTISRNQGLSALTTNISTMTGLTINGGLSVTGTTTSGVVSATTISATTIVSNSILPIKNNVVSGSTFSGNPKKATITFTTAFSDNNYSVTVTGSNSRTFTIESKSSTGFTINANANASFTGEVFWQAIKFGETS